MKLTWIQTVKWTLLLCSGPLGDVLILAGYVKLPSRQDGDLVELSEEGEIASFDYSSAPMFAVDCEMV